MRKLIVSVVALVFAGCSDSIHVAAAPSAPSVLTSPAATNAAMAWRFIGLDALKAKTNLVVFREAAGIPEYEGFKSNLTARLSEHFAKAAVKDGNAGELQKLLTPLVGDLLRYPSLFEKENGPSNICSLAVQLPNDRHEAWKQSWEGILKATKIPGAKLTREGNWTLVSNGSSKAILDRARSPGPEVFTFDGDTEFVKRIWPELAPKRTSVRVTTQGSNLRTEGKVALEKDANFKLEKWNIPVNTVREPLVGFTAIQGLSDRLSKLPIFKDYKAPNQVFIWSADETPFSTYFAARIDNSTNFIRSAADAISKIGKLMGTLEMNTNTHRLTFRGLPVGLPFLTVAPRDPGFVYGCAIPIDNQFSNPLPKELSEQVTTRTNLLFYDWELTGQRLRHVRPLQQSFAIAQNNPVRNYDSPAHLWLIANDKKFANAITEVTLTGPRELSFIRRSDFGLSSLELVELMNWISGPLRDDRSRSVPKPQ